MLHNSAIILKFQVEKNDIKGFSTVLVSTDTPESDNKMLTESTIGIYTKKTKMISNTSFPTEFSSRNPFIYLIQGVFDIENSKWSQKWLVSMNIILNNHIHVRLIPAQKQYHETN